LKTIFIILFSILFFTLLAPVVAGADWKEDQAKADQYYEAGEYNSAFKMYLKLAKRGVSHSQDMVSQMYEKGQGKKVNLEEAYAWSVLAAQRGASEKEVRRDSLLQQANNKKAAEKKADKLMAKYGREALQRKAASKEKLKYNTKSGGCTGSKLGCR
jgi:TPR repeat protein